MAIWKNCRVDTLCYDGQSYIGEPCEIRIDDDSIVVSYKTDDGWVIYTGKNDGSGHFDLRADSHRTLLASRICIRLAGEER